MQALQMGLFLSVPTWCTGEAVTDICSSERRVSVSKGLVCESSLFSSSRRTAVSRAPTGTMASAVYKAEELDLLDCDRPIGRAVVVAVLSSLLRAVRSPTSCGHLQAVSVMSLHDDKCRGKSGNVCSCTAIWWYWSLGLVY